MEKHMEKGREEKTKFSKILPNQIITACHIKLRVQEMTMNRKLTMIGLASLENTGSLTMRFSSFTKSIKSASSGSLPCFLLISRTWHDHFLSLVSLGGLGRSMHIIAGMSETVHVWICVIFSHLSKKSWNFLHASASPGLIWGHCLISLWYAAITLYGSPYLCIIWFAFSYSSFVGSCMQFMTIFLLPQWYIWSDVWGFHVCLLFSFQQLHQRQP